jgi:hypothetical protein
MKVKPIEINWNPELSIFAKESFLKAVSDEYGWLGGFDEVGKLQCILPYTIIKKAIFRMVRFRVETIWPNGELDIEKEKAFLNSTVDYFRSKGADMIIPATTNTIFRTYPDGADAAPYGSYVIDLTQPEEVIWKSIDRIMRQNINSAIKKGVTIRRGVENLDSVYTLIVETFKRSNLPFMSYDEFKKYVDGLGENGEIMIADFNGSAQSYAVFGFSNYCAYAIYAGNVENLQQGANKLIYWEAIRYFKSLGAKSYDFVGARINPEKGSKQEAINSLKKRFGASLKQGYIWKYSIKPIKYKLYGYASKWRSGGDIVDAERHKLVDYDNAAVNT